MDENIETTAIIGMRRDTTRTTVAKPSKAGLHLKPLNGPTDYPIFSI